ncbi:MAG: hypothetical protein MUC81_04865 [Bacteroidia bacterium]|jgi:hypothetical protein|nr:hypothetical protein [Bacteroidia bacterium]
MKVFLSKLILIFIVSSVFVACKGGEIYPIIPSIEFESSYVIFDRSGNDSLIGFIFKFKDGDGDIGLAEGDTFPPYNYVSAPNDPARRNTNFYHYNCYVDYLEKRNGEYKHVVGEFTGDTLRRELRVMSLTPEGKFKAIRGTIEAQIEPNVLGNKADTVKLRFLLIDRALHVSNEIESNDIILRR